MAGVQGAASSNACREPTVCPFQMPRSHRLKLIILLQLPWLLWQCYAWLSLPGNCLKTVSTRVLSIPVACAQC